MRHAAIKFANEIQKLTCNGQVFDAIVVSDMMNVAELKGFLSRPGNACRDLPIILYFHENQFAYPSRFGFDSDQFKRDQHFGFTNFVSAMAADQAWFNSQFNIDSFLEGLRLHAKRWPDHSPLEDIKNLSQKFLIEPPGIELPPIDVRQAKADRERRAEAGLPLHLVWAARWEHDKNPSGLLNGLRELKKRNIEFELSVLGQRFQKVPADFEVIEAEFSRQIRQWGFVESRTEYWRALAAADVFISTAHHEFFGLAAAEAIAVGLVPVFPNRVAYPEMVRRLASHISPTSSRRLPEHRFLYSCENHGPQAFARVVEDIAKRRLMNDSWQVPDVARQKFMDSLRWNARAAEMDRLLAEAASKTKA